MASKSSKELGFPFGFSLKFWGSVHFRATRGFTSSGEKKARIRMNSELSSLLNCFKSSSLYFLRCGLGWVNDQSPHTDMSNEPNFNKTPTKTSNPVVWKPGNFGFRFTLSNPFKTSVWKWMRSGSSSLLGSNEATSSWRSWSSWRSFSRPQISSVFCPLLRPLTTFCIFLPICHQSNIFLRLQPTHWFFFGTPCRASKLDPSWCAPPRRETPSHSSG